MISLRKSSYIRIENNDVDSAKSVPHFPAEDSKLRATSLVKRRGGNCPNTLEVLQQLAEAEDNAHLIFLGVLPSRTSAATQRISNSLPGIDLRHCIYRDGASEAASSYIIKAEKGDSRTIVNYNELEEMSVSEFVTAAGNIASGLPSGGRLWFHFEVHMFHYSVPLHAFSAARLYCRMGWLITCAGPDSRYDPKLHLPPPQKLPPSHRQRRSRETRATRSPRPRRRRRRSILLPLLGRRPRLHRLQTLPRGARSRPRHALSHFVLHVGSPRESSVALGDYRACEAVDYGC